MTALERIKEIEETIQILYSHDNEVVYSTRERREHVAFLLKAFRVAWEMFNEANGAFGENTFDYVDKEFEQRMAKE